MLSEQLVEGLVLGHLMRERAVEPAVMPAGVVAVEREDLDQCDPVRIGDGQRLRLPRTVRPGELFLAGDAEGV